MRATGHQAAPGPTPPRHSTARRRRRRRRRLWVGGGGRGGVLPRLYVSRRGYVSAAAAVLSSYSSREGEAPPPLKSVGGSCYPLLGCCLALAGSTCASSQPPGRLPSWDADFVFGFVEVLIVALVAGFVIIIRVSQSVNNLRGTSKSEMK